jgi:hypothetical protein
MLNLDSSGPRTIRMSPQQLVTLLELVAIPLETAEGKYRNQLLKAAEKLANALNEGLSGQLPESPSTTSRKTAYQFDIVLLDVTPRVWRTLQVLDGTLDEFNLVLQIALGWKNFYPATFRCARTKYVVNDPYKAATGKDGREVTLKQLLQGKRRRMTYTYGPDQAWRLAVELDSAFEPEGTADFPFCLDGHGATPPDDLLGPSYYEDFILALNDTEHREHRHYLELCGGWYDPEAFDLEHTNYLLRRWSRQQ